jgi:DNA repair protein RecO (recombination protein O)
MSLTFRTDAIPLLKRPVKETDRVYSVLSAGHGKLELYAKGSRKVVSKLAGEMENVGVLDLFVVRGRAFDRLAGAAPVAVHDEFEDSFERRLALISSAAFVDRAVKPNHHDPEIYELYREYVDALAVASSNALADGRLSLGLQWKLFSRLGFRPELEVCTRCRKPVSEVEACFTIRHGGVLCRSCREAGVALDASPFPSDARKVLSFLLDAPLSESSRLFLAPALRSATRTLTGAWSMTHLELEPIAI